MTLRRCSLALTFLLAATWGFARSVSVDDAGANTVITIVLELCPDGDVTQQQLRDFVERHRAEVERIFNRNARTFRSTPGGARKRVEMRIQYEFLESCDLPRSADRYRFKVQPGRPPDSERRNASAGEVFLENTARTFAHEIGHALGLDDEYVYEPGGGTNENLMGRGSNKRLTDEHVMTLLFLNHGNPDEAELRCRRLLKAMLRRYSRAEARDLFTQNCPAELFDRLVAMLDANGVTLQPLPPPR